MKVRDFLLQYGYLEDDEMVLTSHGVLTRDAEGEEEYHAILDCPVIGIAVNDEEKEIRFCLDQRSWEMTKRNLEEKP